MNLTTKYTFIVLLLLSFSVKSLLANTITVPNTSDSFEISLPNPLVGVMEHFLTLENLYPIVGLVPEYDTKESLPNGLVSKPTRNSNPCFSYADGFADGACDYEGGCSGAGRLAYWQRGYALCSKPKKVWNMP